MTDSKDSLEVIGFMTLFQKLRNWIDDDPDLLDGLAADDKAIEKLCNELCLSAFSLELREKQHRQLFTSPADPKFIAAWRDYEDRYSTKVARVALWTLAGSFVSTDEHKQPKLHQAWELANDAACEEAEAIDGAMEFLKENILDNWVSHDDFSANLFDIVEGGHRAWQDFCAHSGFDLVGILRRRELVPFVLIPRHVSQSYGSSEILSLFSRLQQAQEAFVFGVHFGAIALMRSIVESAITEHYRSSGSDLKERIDACRSLPKGAPKEALQRLRKIANDVLHSNNDPARFPEDLEKEILSLLYVVRALIEGAPVNKFR